MAAKRRILFLGETYRADAITWITGLKEFGHFEVYTWEMRNVERGWRRWLRFAEYLWAVNEVRKAISAYKPHMVIAERTTSFGYLAARSGHHPIAVAQQGRTDIWPNKSIIKPLKKAMQRYCFKHADLLHSWGPVMTSYMLSRAVPRHKILELPKGIDLRKFYAAPATKPFDKIRAIVTRSMAAEYRHAVILEAFSLLKKKGIDFELVLVGSGPLKNLLEQYADDLGITQQVVFTGIVPNTELPALLKEANIYISMPLSEGVSASLFEAMATSNYPIVADLEGNKSWIEHGVNGYLVPVDDSGHLAESIMAVWSDQQKLKEALHTNFQFVQNHVSYEKNMKLIADKYHSMIDEFYKRT